MFLRVIVPVWRKSLLWVSEWASTLHFPPFFLFSLPVAIKTHPIWPKILSCFKQYMKKRPIADSFTWMMFMIGKILFLFQIKNILFLRQVRKNPQRLRECDREQISSGAIISIIAIRAHYLGTLFSYNVSQTRKSFLNFTTRRWWSWGMVVQFFFLAHVIIIITLFSSTVFIEKLSQTKREKGLPTQSNVALNSYTNLFLQQHFALDYY